MSKQNDLLLYNLTELKLKLIFAITTKTMY